MHGDVVHSRPVAINYGTDAVPQVVVFYGGNDGVLRAVNGNRSTAISSAAAGDELWSFVPPEFYGSLKRLYDNSTRINFPGLLVTTGSVAPKPYGMDGAVAAYRQGTTTAWLFASMRRGGRLIYAFDVSDPAAPSLKWRKGCPNQDNDTGCDTGMDGIGQTWSAPKVVKSTGYGAGNSPMLVFGGGYDKCEDVDTNSAAPACGTGTKGNHIYVLDAATGAQLNSFVTDRAVAGEVTIVERQPRPGADRLRGRPGRQRLPDHHRRRDAGQLEHDEDRLARLRYGEHLHAQPQVHVQAGRGRWTSGVYVILLGSGDREKPLRYYNSALGVANHFYMLVDKPTDTAWLSSESDHCNGTPVLCHASCWPSPPRRPPRPPTLRARRAGIWPWPRASRL